jgi:RNA polymerase sigma-70 factor (ECF subfamily)
MAALERIRVDYESLSDSELTGRNNQRLYRAAWSILKDRSEAEDAVQDGYLKAFAAIDTFAGKSSLSTWLTRIVINEALGRRRAANSRSRQQEGSAKAASSI